MSDKTQIEDFSKMMPVNEDGDLIGGALEGLQEYQKFEVAKKHEALKADSKKLVMSLLKVYFDTEMIDDSEHLSAIRKVETDNLVGLLESSRYAQHAVRSLMLKIDAGLHADLSVYAILIDLQQNALDIQMKVSQYSRTLAPYLRSLKDDMEDLDTTTIDILKNVETRSNTVPQLPNSETEELGDKNFRGSLSMNTYFKEKLEAIEKQKKERKENVSKKLDSNDYSEFENLNDSDLK